MSTEALKKQHQRTLSKANADLADELDTLSVKLGEKERPKVPKIEPPNIETSPDHKPE